MNLNTPKKLTAINDSTNALIKSRASNQDTYAANWDKIFTKKSEEPKHDIVTWCLKKNVMLVEPDGGYNSSDYWEELVTEEEFDRRLNNSNYCYEM